MKIIKQLDSSDLPEVPATVVGVVEAQDVFRAWHLASYLHRVRLSPAGEPTERRARPPQTQPPLAGCGGRVCDAIAAKGGGVMATKTRTKWTVWRVSSDAGTITRYRASLTDRGYSVTLRRPREDHGIRYAAKHYNQLSYADTRVGAIEKFLKRQWEAESQARTAMEAAQQAMEGAQLKIRRAEGLLDKEIRRALGLQDKETGTT